MASEVVFKFVTKSEGGGARETVGGGGTSKRTVGKSGPQQDKSNRIPFADRVSTATPAKASRLKQVSALAQSSIAPKGIKALGGIASGAGAEAAGLSATLGPIAAGVAVVGAAVAVAAAAVVALRAAINNKTALAADYSPEIAGAQARNQVRALRANVETANRLGGNLAKLEDVSGRIGAAVQSATDKLLEPLLEALVPSAQALASVIEAANKSGVFEWMGELFRLIPALQVVELISWALKLARIDLDDDPTTNLFLFFDKMEYIRPDHMSNVTEGKEIVDFRYFSNALPNPMP